MRGRVLGRETDLSHAVPPILLLQLPCRACGSAGACRTRWPRRSYRSPGTRWPCRSSGCYRSCRSRRPTGSCGCYRPCRSRGPRRSPGGYRPCRSRGPRWSCGCYRSCWSRGSRWSCGCYRSCRSRGSAGSCRCYRSRGSTRSRWSCRPRRPRRSCRPRRSRRSSRPCRCGDARRGGGGPECRLRPGGCDRHGQRVAGLPAGCRSAGNLKQRRPQSGTPFYKMCTSGKNRKRANVHRGRTEKSNVKKVRICLQLSHLEGIISAIDFCPAGLQPDRRIHIYGGI